MALILKLFLLTWLCFDGTRCDDVLPVNVTLPSGVNNETFQQVYDQGKGVLKKKCETNSADIEAFNKTVAAQEDFTTCLKSFVNYDNLEEEIARAKPKGELDEVFKKYCDRSDEIMACYKDMTRSVEECLDATEKSNFKTVHNVTEQLVQFICFKDGDRIALFISEEGPQCLEQFSKEVTQCFNDTVGSSINISNAKEFNFETIPRIDFTESECGKLQALQTCVVQTLQGCSQPTPANIADALFKFILRATPCGGTTRLSTITDTLTSTSRGHVIFQSALLLALAQLLARFFRF